MKYIISYDLIGNDDHRPFIDNALEVNGAKRILESQWIMPFDGDTQALYEIVNPLFRDSDRVFIDPLAENWVSRNLIGDININKIQCR